MIAENDVEEKNSESSTSTSDQSKNSNPNISSDVNSVSEVVTVTVYSTSLETISLPPEIDKVCGVSSLNEHLSIFYQRGRNSMQQNMLLNKI